MQVLLPINLLAIPDVVITMEPQTADAQSNTTSMSASQLQMVQVHTVHGWVVHQSITMMVAGQPPIIIGNIMVMASAISATHTAKLAMAQPKPTA